MNSTKIVSFDTAHDGAWNKAGVLHRDLSWNNILIDIRTELPFLNDWDLAKWKEDLEKGATLPGRSVSVSILLLATYAELT